MEEWATQDELGTQLGIDAQVVGELLAAAGLKVGRQATEDALARGLAAPGTSPLGRPFVRWRAVEVLALLQPLAQQVPVPAETTPAARPRRRATPARPAQGPGTTFGAVLAVHAVADPDTGATGWAYVDQRTGGATTGALPSGTGTAGELVAVLHLLDGSPPDSHLLVRSASEDLVRTATVWGATWRRNGWRMRDGRRPENVDLVETLLTAI